MLPISGTERDGVPIGNSDNLPNYHIIRIGIGMGIGGNDEGNCDDRDIGRGLGGHGQFRDRSSQVVQVSDSGHGQW